MRTLFWLLVAGNVIFFISAGWISAGNARNLHEQAAVDTGGPGLVLVGERPRPSPSKSMPAADKTASPKKESRSAAGEQPARVAMANPAPTEQGAKPPAKSKEAQCFIVGPYTQNLDATSAVMQLKERGLQAKMRSQQEQVAKGYWVYIPPLPNRDEAKNMMREMERNNIESFIVTKGNKTNAVSVGIYGELVAAEARRDELRAKGFGVELEERASSSTEFWVQVPVNSEKEMLSEIEQALANGASGKRLERAPCQ